MKIVNYKLLAALSAVCLLSSPVSADWDDFGNDNNRGFGGSTPQSFGQSNSFSSFSFQSFHNSDPYPDMPPYPDPRDTSACEEWAWRTASNLDHALHMIFGGPSGGMAGVPYINVSALTLDNFIRCAM